MNSESPSKSILSSSGACRPWQNNVNDENAYCPPQTPDRTASMHASLTSTSPSRSIMNALSNQEVPGRMQSPTQWNETTHKAKLLFNGKECIEMNRKRSSNE
jgi:hypothetical protein